MSLELTWLPEIPNWKDALHTARKQPPEVALPSFVQLANSRLDFVRAGQLDKAVQSYLKQSDVTTQLPVVRLALLGSSTLTHLHAGIRLGALRRGILLEIYGGTYGLYRQELADPESGLYRFRPGIVCFAFDAAHLVPNDASGIAETMANLQYCWKTVGEALGCAVIQQTALPRFPTLMGNNEDRLPTSQASLVTQLNQAIREQAREKHVSLLSLDSWAAESGVASWFEPSLWYAAKQEVHPRASVLYGDQLGRLIAAMQGRSAKCLVLDLDNTLWGGVIGDDGLDGIALGQGSATGEAFVAFQQYVRQLASRGVILAVCSKNDHANAIAPFETHPEMVLRSSDIACFVANWQDKAANLRHIAQTLNIGLDALVFADDNPAERRLIRSELPMVAVPELPEDPESYVSCLANAGYFEAIEITGEDRERTQLYRANASREALRQTSTDLGSYLRGLEMQLLCSSFDELGFNRIVQLIGKTNQFNLTTQRYTEADVRAIMRNPSALTMQLRLTDIHGDNGVIGIVIGVRHAETLNIENWLMSCRVLGREVEQATLNLLCARASAMGCSRLLGVYRPSAKNVLVREHYGRLGFTLLESMDDGSTRWILPLHKYIERPTPIRAVDGDVCKAPNLFMSTPS